MPDVVLLINGQRFSGWETVQITKNVQAVSAGFALSVSQSPSAQNQALIIKPSDACAIELDGVRVITGYVDKINVSIDAGQHRFSVSGRDKTGDLVDSSILNSPAEFIGLTLDRIVSMLCEPFDIAVQVQTDVGTPIAVFSLQPSESPWEAIERASRLRGVLVYSNPLGEVVITRRNATRTTTALVEGQNIKAASAEYSHQDRFDLYRVEATSPWADELPPEFANAVEGEARDSNIVRYRPKIIKAEAAGSTAQAQTRAQWEATVRAGRSGTYQITLPNWTQANGELWAINTLVAVNSPSLAINSDLLIAGVVFSKNNQNGSTTQLSLMRADAFEPQPEIPMNTDPWDLVL